MNNKDSNQVPSHIKDVMDGKHFLIIGGDRRPEQLRRLLSTFPKTTFSWKTTRKNNAALGHIARLITDPIFSHVIILHGLARHGHSLGARRICSEIGKSLLWCWCPTPAEIIRSLSNNRAK